MKIYGTPIRGNCLKVKWVCDRLGVALPLIEINTLKGENRTPEFLKLNAAGQVPTVVLEDGRTLAQSNGIHPLSARGSDLIPADTPTRRPKWTNGCYWEQNQPRPFGRCRFRRSTLQAGIRP